MKYWKKITSKVLALCALAVTDTARSHPSACRAPRAICCATSAHTAPRWSSSCWDTPSVAEGAKRDNQEALSRREQRAKPAAQQKPHGAAGPRVTSSVRLVVLYMAFTPRSMPVA